MATITYPTIAMVEISGVKDSTILGYPPPPQKSDRVRIRRSYPNFGIFFRSAYFTVLLLHQVYSTFETDSSFFRLKIKIKEIWLGATSKMKTKWQYNSWRVAGLSSHKFFFTPWLSSFPETRPFFPWLSCFPLCTLCTGIIYVCRRWFTYPQFLPMFKSIHMENRSTLTSVRMFQKIVNRLFFNTNRSASVSKLLKNDH